MTPQPPSGTQVGISTVMAGEILKHTDGSGESVALADMVLLTLTRDGEQIAAMQMTIQEAFAVAQGLSGAAGRLIDAQIGDDGKPLPLLQRLAQVTVRP